MRKPIFRVFVNYSIKNSKGITRRPKTGTIDTFVLTNNLEEIKEDEVLHNRIFYLHKIKDKKKFTIEIKNIEVEGQYGETTDRF